MMSDTGPLSGVGAAGAAPGVWTPEPPPTLQGDWPGCGPLSPQQGSTVINNKRVEPQCAVPLPNRRVLAWFSHGVASAIAVRMALTIHGPGITIANIDTGSEHEDNPRFRADCERWYDHEIIVLKSKKYEDIYDVFDKTGYLVGPGGARCTAELKKKVRHGFERPDDIQYFGYTANIKDAARSVRFLDQNPGVDARFPLVEKSLTKGDCLALVQRAGIRLPVMYELGYVNNNCIGCVKGGMGYWNKVRVDFPQVFDKMARQERKMNRTVLRNKGEALFLDDLDPNRGDYKAEMISDCSLDCQFVEREYVS